MSQATTIAKLLLDVKAVAINVSEPFRYASGVLSPIYCDNRLLISSPEARTQVIEAFLNLIEEQNLEFDVVAGTATAGIPHAAWLADRLNKPMVYVRGSAKGHGKQNLIEGRIEAGQVALVVEDLISTGGSAVNAGLALRAAGAVVNDCVAIFSYEMQSASEKFEQNNIKLHSLSDFSSLMTVASSENYISAQDKTTASSWNQDPAGWGKKMGYE